MALTSRSTLRSPIATSSILLPQRPLRLVLARAEPPSGGAKVTREFREGDSEVTIPGAPTIRNQSDGMYVDVDAPPPRPKKDNLSKEMKARLRQEYTGLGGAENSEDDGELPTGVPAITFAAPSPRRPYIVAAVAIEQQPTAADLTFAARPPGATLLDAEPSTSGFETTDATAIATGATATAVPKKGASKWVIDENENLTSTPEQRAWTWVSIALIAATFQQAITQISSPEDVAVMGSAVFLAYVLSDLGTGIYHWGVDNYGDGSTPVFGRQIAAFQGHHQRPWTIAQREFANNMHQVFGPASYPAAALLVLSPVAPLAWNAWSSSFLFLACMSQQFHAWSHMKKSQLPTVVLVLQDAGVLISRRMHGAHHRAPFEGNYSIVSGWWNPLLDSSGFFRVLEKVIHKYTGVAPRCWDEKFPEDWRELTPPPSSDSDSE